MPGASYGQPGGSLEAGQDLSWAANSRVAEAGRLGEIEVGNALIDIVAEFPLTGVGKVSKKAQQG